jgi:hypothetical protein
VSAAAGVFVSCRGIESIAKMTSLNFLGLHDCNSITNKGIDELKALKGLHTLSLRGCRKLTNNGMKVIKVGTLTAGWRSPDVAYRACWSPCCAEVSIARGVVCLY